MYAVNASDSLGAFARWIDRPLIGVAWPAMVVAFWPVIGFAFNRRRGR